MAQQTAVEWFYDKISNIEVNFDDGNLIDKIFEQAKSMEVELLEDCWIAAEQSKDSQTFFNYYNETYNKCTMAQQNAFEYFDSVNKFASENQSNKTKQQTAAGWIEDNIQSDMTFMEIMGLIRQAKAMEKEQIIDAYENGVSDENESNLSGLFTNAEQYYNKTYKK
jgi:hypothetical protein